MLIAAVTPSFLEKGADWFSQNQSSLEKEKNINPWLARNILIVESGQKISLSAFLRQIAEIGYTKVWETRHPGEFSQRGGIIRLFPINTKTSWTIEFDGNYISDLLKSGETKSLSESASEPATTNSAQLQMVGVREKKQFPRGLRREENDLVRAQQKNYKFSSAHSGFQFGDYVVHIDHGIGIFRGATDEDFIIEYAAPQNRPEAPDKLFVPKTQQNRLQPYLGFKKPTIHRLGTPIWSITKKKAKEDIIAYAKTLLATLAARHTITRTPYTPHPEQEEELEASFLHENTPDQKKAIKEIHDDMTKHYPMDRILTGDVGFGKTEVALRAAFRAILNGKQVTLLAPTTILADQHFDLFSVRFEPFGINVARLTRIETSEEIKHTVSRLATGTTDIVIGTHKVLGKHIEFKNLGLLIIDEEQKFGVAHKEQLKKTYPMIDILTLSATPIPRTLHLGLSKIQSLSQITTAPHGRMEIKTFVLPKNKKIMTDAINAELARGGQVYFLANRIHKIPKILEEIKKLKLEKTVTPEPLVFESASEPARTREGLRREKNKGSGVSIAILHGRMKDEAIIQTMHDFRAKKIDILVSTTIIENGLDISDANTLIVENATLLGLAQAHQLRGRIGRGDKEAFSYFLYPNHKLSEKAAERLEALERYSWLGAGIEIAKRDLELRGCGNILGKAQSGVAYRVGLNLYFQMLEDAVQNLKTQN